MTTDHSGQTIVCNKVVGGCGGGTSLKNKVLLTLVVSITDDWDRSGMTIIVIVFHRIVVIIIDVKIVGLLLLLELTIDGVQDGCSMSNGCCGGGCCWR